MHHFLAGPRQSFGFQERSVVDAMPARTTQPHVPQDHPPPVTNHRLSLRILCGCQVPTLAFSVLYEGLDAHSWPILLDILVVRIHLCIGSSLHHVTNEVRSGREDQFRDENDNLVFEGLFLVGRSIAVVEIDSDVDVEGLDDVVVVDAVVVLVVMKPTKNSD